MRQYITKIDNTFPAPSGLLPADEDNVRFAELTNAVATAGILLDDVDAQDTDLSMLAQAVARYVSAGIFCQDTGSANAYALGITAGFQAPKALFTGLRVLYYPANTSTGASTVNAFGIGNRKLFRADGSAIQAGDIYANRLVDAFYDETLDSGAGAFRLAPWSVPPSVLSATAVPLSGEGIVVDNTYHVGLNFPNLLAVLPAAADLFAFYSQTGQHHRILTLAQLIAVVQAALPALSLTQVAPLLTIQERRANGVLRSTVPRNTWTKRPLSDVVTNQISGASLNGSNQIVLPPGTYRVNWTATVSKSGNHRSRLFDVTTQIALGTGTASDSLISGASNHPSTPSVGTTRITIPAGGNHTLELQHSCAVGGPGDDPHFGDWRISDITVNSPGAYHVDAWISLVKEA